ncbi:Uncharacterized conserved protein [Plasmopara halstedii]|uniref:Uncharacterized conserved protein n=1 Tax=Plasmopara halstedii TaxID=4781 RepID=A0A0P1AD75_PLAHL|nr:Uncharacterized conserved protein [Plasmopara halstedii]CEG38303.1 Uncharacterized conserved protein [Plasmopara halstedii]|eukprot:XP_024574672.1 Uncharacterized conserved protein [Plasmopara halstedii]
MSLAFLSKKSWHTANLRNVEKVWIAEQKHAAEEKKVAELLKNIEEERQLQELRKMQAAHGDKSATVERVDWMYEGPSAAREKTAEEYLLGKEYKGDGEKTAKDNVDLSSTSKYGSLALNKSTLPAHDAFQRLNEDPMMLIRKRQQAARDEVLKNPVKMKKIKDQVNRLKGDKKALKKAKKAAKKEKKHARKEEKRRLKKRKILDEGDMSSSSGDDSRGKDWQKHYKSRARSRSRLDRRSRSSVLPRRVGDQTRGRSRYRERDLDHRGHTCAQNRINRSSSVQYMTKPRVNRCLRRSASSTSDYHSRSPSRSVRRDKMEDRTRSDRASKREKISSDRSFFSKTQPRQQQRDRRHFKKRRSYSRCRSSVSRRGQRRSRSPESRRELRRSRSTDSRGQRRSRSTDSRGQRRSRSSDSCQDLRRSRSPDGRRELRRSRSPDFRREKRRFRSLSRRRDRSPSRHREHSRRQPSFRKDHDRVEGRQREKEPETILKPSDTAGKYGLVTKSGAIESKDVDKTSLGPNAKHLAKARESKRLEDKERQRKLGKSRGQSPELTHEEKKLRAQQMVQDAKDREDYITKLATLKQKELDKREEDVTKSNPEFLRKLHSDAYLNETSNMSDRLRRNAHYIQKKADSSNFLSK